MGRKSVWIAAWIGMMLLPGVPVIADTIDFEGLPPGTIVSELSKGQGISGDLTGVVRVEGHNGIFPGRNAAIVFDSTCAEPPPWFPVTMDGCDISDVDLGAPNEDFGGPGIGVGGELGSDFANTDPLGNVIVLGKDLVDDYNNGTGDPGEDGLVDDPDDADVPGYIDFDFSGVRKNRKNGTVRVDSVTIMDIEFDEGEDPALIEFTGPGILPATIAVVDTGNNGVKTITNIGLEGVRDIRVNVKGSSAFVGIVFDEGQPGECWITTGGFHNAGVASGGKDYTFGGNVGPPPSGSWQVIDHNTGDNFHSNDVHITRCETISGTGPGQPGGNKGFDINIAYFEGTGRLNHIPGYPFEGYVIDSGEPSGKKGNDKDYFNIVVMDKDPPHTSVVFEADGELDGGNVQIHPPTGKP